MRIEFRQAIVRRIERRDPLHGVAWLERRIAQVKRIETSGTLTVIAVFRTNDQIVANFMIPFDIEGIATHAPVVGEITVVEIQATADSIEKSYSDPKPD